MFTNGTLFFAVFYRKNPGGILELVGRKKIGTKVYTPVVKPSDARQLRRILLQGYREDPSASEENVPSPPHVSEEMPPPPPSSADMLPPNTEVPPSHPFFINHGGVRKRKRRRKGKGG